MPANGTSLAPQQGWRHRLADGMYQTGLLGAFQVATRYCELRGNGGAKRLQRVRNPKYIVLGYHNVGEGGLPLYCRLPKRVFAEQMSYIRRHYRVISLIQMVEELRDPPASGQSVVVTFDDGYAGTYLGAFPVLKEYAIPATVYLTAGSIETGEAPWYDRIFLQLQQAAPQLALRLDVDNQFELNNFGSRVEAATTVVMYLRTLRDDDRRRWCESLDRITPLIPRSQIQGAMMNWDQIREMQAAGISFACHTMTHPVLSRLDAEAMRKEIVESKRLIENRLDTYVSDFAFPFGKPNDCSSIAASTLRELGLKTAMTTIVGVNQPGADLFRLRRMVQGNETSLAMFVYRLQRLLFHPVDEERETLANCTSR
jgi:peptidoglycan/xylan/chitin deacetylase (PgdA/CDA1 family)